MTAGWHTRPLQEFCDDPRQDIVDGPFGSELQRKDYTLEGVPVLKIQNVKPHKIELKKMDFVSREKFQTLQRHSYQQGDIVITKLGDPLGASAVVENIDHGVIVADLVRIRAQRINTKFLCYQLNSQRTSEFINSMQKGTTRPRVTLSVVRELPISAPSLEEQVRIVAILDEAFANIVLAKASVEKNLRNARDLFGSVSQEFLDSVESDEMSLESVAAEDCTLSYGIVQPGDDVKNGLPVVRPVDLTRDVITLDGLKRIDPELATSYQRTRLQGGELLLCVRGTTGTVSIASPELEGANVTRGIVPIRFKPGLVSAAFGYHLMKSVSVQSQIREKTYGTALMQINIGDLRNVSVKLPSMAKQQGLAERLDSLRQETADLESLYTRKLAALDELKQSLLQRAFSGAL